MDVVTLRSIFRITGGDYWLDSTGWKTSQDYCEWFGITCDEEGFIYQAIMSQERSLPNHYQACTISRGLFCAITHYME